MSDANEGWRKVAEKFRRQRAQALIAAQPFGLATIATDDVGDMTDFGRLVAEEQKRWYAAHGNWPQEWELLAAISGKLEERK
jgi:hypothetical protein